MSPAEIFLDWQILKMAVVSLLRRLQQQYIVNKS